MRKIICLFLLIALCSCASVTSYPLNLSFWPKSSEEASRKGTIGVALFNDKRAVADKNVIGVREQDNLNFTSVAGDPSSVVPRAIIEYLASRGYTALPINKVWDGDVQSLKAEWGDIVVGGQIEKFEITVSGEFPKVTYNCSVTLYVRMADPGTKTILHEEKVESGLSYKDVAFSRDEAEKQMNKALAEAVESSASGIGQYIPKPR